MYMAPYKGGSGGGWGNRLPTNDLPTDNRYSASPLDLTFGLRAEFQIGWQKSTMKILRHEGFAFHMVSADTDANGNVAAFLSFSHSNSTNPEIRSHFTRVSSPPRLKGKSTHPPLPPIPR